MLSSKIIVIIAIIAFAILFTFCALLINKHIRIKKIATNILKEAKDKKEIENAFISVKRYNTDAENLKNAFAEADKAYQDEMKTNATKFFNFGHKKRLEELLQKRENAQKEKDEYELAHNEEYQNCLKIIELVGKNFFIANKSKIWDKLDSITQKMTEKEQAERQQKVKEQEQIRKQLEDKIRSDREKQNKENEQKNISDKITRAIRELEEFMPTLQEDVREKNLLNFQMLSFIEWRLDTIVDNKKNIDIKYFNNIESMQLKLKNIFNDFRNDKNLQPNIEIIEARLLEILKAKPSV